MITNVMLRELFPKGEFQIDDACRQSISAGCKVLQALQRTFNPVLDNADKIGPMLDTIFLNGAGDPYTVACQFSPEDRKLALNAMRLSEVLYRFHALFTKADGSDKADAMVDLVKPIYLPAVGAMLIESVINSTVSDAIRSRYSELKDVQPEMLLEWRIESTDTDHPKVFITAYRDEVVQKAKQEDTAEDDTSEPGN